MAEDVNFKEEAMKLVNKYGKLIGTYNVKRKLPKMKKLQESYNEYVKKAQNEIVEMINKVDAKLKQIGKVDDANNAYEYFERQQRKQLSITEKNRREILNELDQYKTKASSAIESLSSKQDEATAVLKKEAEETTNESRKKEIEQGLEESKKVKDSISSSMNDISKPFDGTKQVIESMELEVKKVRIGLAMKGIQTEDTLLNAIYDEKNKSGIYGTLIKIQDYLVKTEKSKSSAFTRDTQKYLDLIDKDPAGVKLSFGRLEAAAKLDIPKVEENVNKRGSNDLDNAKKVVPELEDKAKEIVSQAIKKVKEEYTFDTNITEENVGEKLKEIEGLQKKFESLKSGNVKSEFDAKQVVEEILKNNGLNVDTFSNVALSLLRIMVLGKVYKSLLDNILNVGTGSGGGFIKNLLVGIRDGVLKVLKLIGKVALSLIGTLLTTILGVGATIVILLLLWIGLFEHALCNSDSLFELAGMIADKVGDCYKFVWSWEEWW